ncbi:DUF6328 family protein [Pseudonocardia sp. N23]|uniref:DUF6328 family protein n=1 Tax=Pseudonocardia sp. N23 TaxID=1987376 RepID=UPI000BFCA1C3|nr:DUF6328 family protein [Pseudonocardia sp. N23]GAY07584.1 hypothetical protein TOK_3604 [Pseudonocardia sp. N23]
MADDVDEPESDSAWNWRARRETATERLDRNWADLLQELRVVQTGVQLLTGLLLTVPFQQRFVELSSAQRIIYLAALGLSVTSAALLIAPVAAHRLLFRRHSRLFLVSTAQRLAVAGLAALALGVTCVVLLIFDVVLGTLGGVIACGVTGALFGGLWLVLPLRRRRQTDDTDDADADTTGSDGSSPDRT